ncbi:SDR family NAD(P)-dependent oxidoreductase [Thorsellia kenyensis]|uniref:SDR family NAD(P)-dependent oxidoreductase n=1 Tax=Thorsellia kenyensis TaxID=1549888 RepID=A0ABV6CD38_9GAMM
MQTTDTLPFDLDAILKNDDIDYSLTKYHSLKGKYVLITGGASGIGEAFVKAFHAQGSIIAFIDVDEKSAANLINSFSENKPTFYACDLRNIDALRETISKIEQHFDHAIDILINNAGKDDRHTLDELEPDYWDNCLGLNLKHHIFCAQAVAKKMAQQSKGVIINMGSISWMRGRPGMIGYTTSKAAINGMTRSLARELGDKGIRVNSIVPGAIVTERQARLWLTPELNQEFINLQALKYRLTASDIARAALFMASDEARGITGQNMIIDAGLTQN